MKLKVAAVIFFMLAGVGMGFFLTANRKGEVLGNEAQVQSNSEINSLYSPSATPAPIPITAKPRRISIPTLGVDAKIEEVGIDSEGKMDVPKDDLNAGWWKYGTVPGGVGNSVIAGHYDRRDGGPAIFYDLSKLNTGDQIIIEDENGTLLTFEVTGKENYKVSDFPIDSVFAKTDNRNLNLITCNGAWDIVNKSYSDRLVIFSELVE